MVPGFGVSAECQSIGTIEHNASPYWQDNGWPLNKDGSCCISSISCQSIGTLHESGWTKAWCPGLVSRPSVPYFELSFLGCGFLIHLSNMSNSPRFRAPWKKIHQKCGTRQELSLVKGHPLSCQYGDALCSMIPT